MRDRLLTDRQFAWWMVRLMWQLAFIACLLFLHLTVLVVHMERTLEDSASKTPAAKEEK